MADCGEGDWELGKGKRGGGGEVPGKGERENGFGEKRRGEGTDRKGGTGKKGESVWGIIESTIETVSSFHITSIYLPF